MNTIPPMVEDILARLAQDVDEARARIAVALEAVVAAAAAAAPPPAPAPMPAPAPTPAPMPAPRASGAQPRFSEVRVATPTSGAAQAEWTADEAGAVMKCIMSWLAMGPPSDAPPDSRCVAAGRELLPTWAERELARAAVRKVPAKQ